jgi:hypothetical protein
MKNRAEGKENEKLESKWGFLKNIINIDVFFAGPGTKSEVKADDKSADETEPATKSVDVEDTDDNARDVRDGEEIKPKSSWRPAKSKPDTSKYKKTSKSDLEDALEDGEVVTDSDGNIWKKNDSKKEKEIK